MPDATQEPAGEIRSPQIGELLGVPVKKAADTERPCSERGCGCGSAKLAVRPSKGTGRMTRRLLRRGVGRTRRCCQRGVFGCERQDIADGLAASKAAGATAKRSGYFMKEIETIDDHCRRAGASHMAREGVRDIAFIEAVGEGDYYWEDGLRLSQSTGKADVGKTPTRSNAASPLLQKSGRRYATGGLRCGEVGFVEDASVQIQVASGGYDKAWIVADGRVAQEYIHDAVWNGLAEQLKFACAPVRRAMPAPVSRLRVRGGRIRSR